MKSTKIKFVNAERLPGEEFRCINPTCTLGHRLDINDFRQHILSCPGREREVISSDSGFNTDDSMNSIWDLSGVDERGSVEEPPAVSWSNSDTDKHAQLTAQINNGPAELHKTTCPNPGCRVRGRPMLIHLMWCKHQPIRRHLHCQSASGQIRLGLAHQSASGILDEFISFNLSFLETLELSFDIIRRRIRVSGSGIHKNLRYTILFKLGNFSYKIKGNTSEVKSHRLTLPETLLQKRMLVRYNIKIYNCAKINNDQDM
jgi:hypothetical protein